MTWRAGWSRSRRWSPSTRWPRGRFAPAAVLELAARYRGARGWPGSCGLADRRAGSPMETRLRLVLVLRGLPVPEVQYPVPDDRRRRAVWLDLAYPEHRIGIEYEGEEHVRTERVLRDIGRYTALVDGNWRIYRFTKYEVYGDRTRSPRRSAGRSVAPPARWAPPRRAMIEPALVASSTPGGRAGMGGRVAVLYRTASCDAGGGEAPCLHRQARTCTRFDPLPAGRVVWSCARLWSGRSACSVGSELHVGSPDTRGRWLR